MQSSTDSDVYIGTNNINKHYKGHQQKSNIAKYGQMSMSESKRPSSLGNIQYSYSISGFSQELERLTDKAAQRADRRYRQKNNRRMFTEGNLGQSGMMNFQKPYERQYSRQLQNQLNDIKRLVAQQSKVSSVESRLDRFLNEIERRQQLKSQQSQPNYVYPPPNPFMYPPLPPPNYYQEPKHRRKRAPSEDLYSEDSQQAPKKVKKKPRKQEALQILPTPVPKKRKLPKLKKFFYAVAFISILRKESHKLAKARKVYLKKFWMERFDSQMENIKNWLLQGMKYSMSIILEKRQLSFNFLHEPKEKVKEQKQKLVLKLVYIFCDQLKKLSNPKDVSQFSQILTLLCRNGSFPIGRFWTAHQMQKLKISEYYGFIRSNKKTELQLIGIFIFMKMFIFNMLLQPYKFDNVNFSKNSEPLLSNMYLMGSVLYHIVCQVLSELQQIYQHPMYEGGNWLDVKKQFITECCEPLKFNTNKAQQGEYISGMIDKPMFYEMLEYSENEQTWKKIKTRVRDILQNLYTEMKMKSKMMKFKIKQKMRN